MKINDEIFMREALKEANLAYLEKEVPVGAVIVVDNKIVARAHNLKEKNNDATQHAEILAIQRASKSINNWRLSEATIYVTLEPCPMCAGAILASRIKRLVFAAFDKRSGAIISSLQILNDKNLASDVEVSFGVLEEEASKLISDFFRENSR